mmetsp:Transcript_40047/g.103666  ORF Transcript_40047/g.103666 Transcript_40047/m.103666 type:complete len:237 (-) Transcript_40047:189-899(-)
MRGRALLLQLHPQHFHRRHRRRVREGEGACESHVPARARRELLELPLAGGAVADEAVLANSVAVRHLLRGHARACVTGVRSDARQVAAVDEGSLCSLPADNDPHGVPEQTRLFQETLVHERRRSTAAVLVDRCAQRAIGLEARGYGAGARLHRAIIDQGSSPAVRPRVERLVTSLYRHPSELRRTPPRSLFALRGTPPLPWCSHPGCDWLGQAVVALLPMWATLCKLPPLPLRGHI